MTIRRLTTVVGISLVTATAGFAAPLNYEFSLNGWSDGGTFSGSFMGEDLNNDGQLSSFDGEVTDFSATYLSSQFFSITFDSLTEGPFGFGGVDEEENIGGGLTTGLVFTLDGTGQLGDDTLGGGEALAAFGRTSGSDFGNDVFLAVGPGPFNQCDGSTICGGVFNAEDVSGPTIIVAGDVVTVNDVPPNSLNNLPPPQNNSDAPIGPDLGFNPAELALSTNTSAITVTADDLGDPEGLFESSPVMPDVVNDNGGFEFELSDIRNLPGRIFFIDPEIATGYTYEITGDSFFSVQAPSLAAVADGDGQYLLSYVQGGTQFEQTLLAGELFEFGPDGVLQFTITGIDTALMLDPTDGEAFVTGVSLVAGNTTGTITQTPITVDISAVPLPAGGMLLLSGFAGLAFVRRRNSAARA